MGTALGPTPTDTPVSTAPVTPAGTSTPSGATTLGVVVGVLVDTPAMRAAWGSLPAPPVTVLVSLATRAVGSAAVSLEGSPVLTLGTPAGSPSTMALLQLEVTPPEP